MNYFAAIEMLQFKGAQIVEFEGKRGIFVPIVENGIKEFTGKDNQPHAQLSLNAREFSGSYLNACQGAKPTHGLELIESRTKENELFGEMTVEVQKEHPEWRELKPSENEDFRKEVYGRIRAQRVRVGKLYGSNF